MKLYHVTVKADGERYLFGVAALSRAGASVFVHGDVIGRGFADVDVLTVSKGIKAEGWTPGACLCYGNAD